MLGKVDDGRGVGIRFWFRFRLPSRAFLEPPPHVFLLVERFFSRVSSASF